MYSFHDIVRKYGLLLVLVFFFIHRSSVAAKEEEKKTERYKIAVFDWPHVEAPYTISLWVLLASVAKIGFHLSKKFASIFPDSSLLIVLGLMVGIILFFSKIDEHTFRLESEVFFLFLLPQIVFDAGYFMPNRSFFDNLGSILVYAVIGTLWNMATIGTSLYFVGQVGMFDVPTPILDCLLFSSLISAVDPVAVLVVFEEIHVNEILFIVVFGESLLNDAVTVVLYHMFESFSEIGQENIISQDIIFGFISFFVVGLGGVLIGIIWAIITSFTTRWTKHVRVLEPLFVLLMGYCSYLTAEMFHLSGILAIVFCGISMKQYVEGNICQKSNTTVKYFLKMLSNSSETIIFMFLGLSTVSTSHHWNTAFVGLTVLFCLIYRALGVVIQTFFLNMVRLNRLDKVEQFIMAYGGLRGAIAYGLVVALPDSIPAKDLFITACIVVIYFTVFLQGMTIKPLVNFLKVKKDEKRQKTMNEQLFERISDHAMAGAEIIAKQHGHHWLRNKYEYLNTRYLKPLLMREPPKITDTTIIEVYTKLSMKDAMDHMEMHGNFAHHGASASMPIISPANEKADYSYANPAFDMNSLDKTTGKKIQSEGKLKHLSMDVDHNSRKRRRYNRQSPSVGSDDSDDDEPRHRRRPDRTPTKKVSFSLDGIHSQRLESRRSTNSGFPDTAYVVDEHVGQPRSPTTGRKLTAAESHLPWKEYYHSPAPLSTPAIRQGLTKIENALAQAQKTPSSSDNGDSGMSDEYKSSSPSDEVGDGHKPGTQPNPSLVDEPEHVINEFHGDKSEAMGNSST